MKKYTYKVTVTHWVEFTDTEVDGSTSGDHEEFAQYAWGDESEFEFEIEINSVELFDTTEVDENGGES